MSVYEAQIPNLEMSVVKPIVQQALEHIRHNFFPDSRIPIQLIDQTGSAMEVGSTINGDTTLRLETNKIIQAHYTDLSEEDIVLTTLVDTEEMLPVFYDHSLDMRVYPVKSQNNLTINVTYRGASKADVDNWINYVYTKAARGSIRTLFSPKYEVSFPEDILHIINAVHVARETQAGYGDNLLQYTTKHLLFPYDLKTNYLGKSTTLVLRDELKGVALAIGTIKPEPSREDNNTYTGEVTFTCRYDKPISMTINYPTFVHNNYIDARFFNTDLNRNLDIKLRNKSDYGLLNDLSYLMDKSSEAILSRYGYIVPEFDEFIPDYRGKRIIPLLQIQLAVEPNSSRVLLDLNAIKLETGFELHEDIIPYLSRLGNRSFVYGGAAIYLAIWRNGEALDPTHYIVNKEGEIVSDYDLNLRGNYHLTIGITEDLGLIGEGGCIDLSDFGELTNTIIGTICPELPKEDYPPMLDKGQIRPTVLPTHIKQTIDKIPYYHRVGGNKWFVVNSIIVKA